MQVDERIDWFLDRKQLSQLRGPCIRVPEDSSSLETAYAGASVISRLTIDCGLDPHLGSYGAESARIPELAKSAMTVTRLLRNNPRPVTEADCIRYTASAFDLAATSVFERIAQSAFQMPDRSAPG